MQKRIINVVATLALVIMIARDLRHEYQTSHSVGAVFFFAIFYSVFWGYFYYCYRKYND